MNTLDSFQQRNVITKITALIDKVTATCDALVSALEIDSKTVATYWWVVISKVEKQPDYVDVVILNISKIKNHLRDLKTRTWFITTKSDVTTILDWLYETSKKLDVLLHSNWAFLTTFELPIQEIQESITAVVHHLAA